MPDPKAHQDLDADDRREVFFVGCGETTTGPYEFEREAPRHHRRHRWRSGRRGIHHL
ncbi:MAG: hypothetical protein K0V04_17525 [Deltaproteobacteria bacterium]|nr:hypothetical protein [Deltaproteobacteria bacterium]